MKGSSNSEHDFQYVPKNQCMAGFRCPISVWIKQLMNAGCLMLVEKHIIGDESGQIGK